MCLKNYINAHQFRKGTILHSQYKDWSFQTNIGLAHESVSCLHYGLTYARKFLIGPQAVAGRVLWNRVCPSFCLSFRRSFCLSGHFLGIASLVFSKSWHDARNPYKVVHDRAGFSRKKFFAPKIGKMGQKWSKNRVFWIYWLLIFTGFVL